MGFAGVLVAPWSLTQAVAGSNPFTVMTNILVTKFSEFNKSFRESSDVKSDASRIKPQSSLC